MEKDPEAEIASRAAHLIRTITILEQIAPALIKALPGIEERLADENVEWTRSFLKASELAFLRSNRDILSPADVHPLANNALKHASTAKEKILVCHRIREWHFTQAADEVVNLLTSPVTDVKKVGLWAIRDLRLRDHWKEVWPLLSDPDRWVREGAVGVLGEQGERSVIPTLLRVLEKDDPNVQGAAGRALVDLGAMEVVPDLIRIASDADSGAARLVSIRTLADFGARELVPVVEHLLKESKDDIVAGFALLDLGLIDTPGSRSLLLKELAHESAERSSAAARSLGWLRVSSARDGIVALLGRPEESVRVPALYALGELKDTRGTEAALNLLKGDFSDRLAAAVYLCKIGRSEGIPVILGSERRYFSLNALRCPSTWEKLRQIPVTEDLRGTVEAMIQEISRITSLPIEISSDLRRDPWFQQNFVRVRKSTSKEGMLGLLEVIFSDDPCPVVLETDRIRILPEQEVVGFWKSFRN